MNSIELNSLETFTDQGPYLAINEDGVSFDVEKKLFMVFDGFGGAGVGDSCVKELIGGISSFYGQVVEDADSTMPFYFNSQYQLETNSLVNANIFSHRKLIEKNLSAPMNKRAGASGISLAIQGSLASLVLVGNCQGFLLRDSKIQPLFIPENLAFFGLSNRSFNKDIPLAAFGLYDVLDFKIRELRLRAGDQLILGTDGIFSVILEKDLERLLLNSSIQEKCSRKIADFSNKMGNIDNQTLMILKF